MGRAKAQSGGLGPRTTNDHRHGFRHCFSARSLEYLRPIAIRPRTRPRALSWGQPGSFSVQFVFLNAVPTTNTLGYLKLLSAMARLGKEPALLEQFKAAAGAKELMELLAKIPVRKSVRNPS